MNHHVYALVEGLNIRYVGYTERLVRRRRVHASKHPDWSMLILGIYPSREIGLEHEKWWIRRLFDVGHPLVNISDGGNYCPVGLMPSMLTRAKISAAEKGKHVSFDTRAKLSAANIGKRHFSETRAKISAAGAGRRFFC